MPISSSTPHPANGHREDFPSWWEQLSGLLEVADLTNAAIRRKLDATAAQANNYGLQLVGNWQYAPALPVLSAAIEAWARLGQIAGLVNARNARGAAYRHLGEYAAALDDFGAALRLADARALTSAAIYARCGLAAAYLDMDAHDQAEASLKQAQTLAEAQESPSDTATVHYWQGRLAEARKDWLPAQRAYQQAVDTWHDVPAPAEEVEAQAGVMRTLLAQGYAVEAYTLAQQVLRHLAEKGPERLDEPLRVYWSVYRVLHMAREEEDAREILRAAYTLMVRQMEGLETPEQRERFRERVPLHRAVAEAWQELVSG